MTHKPIPFYGAEHLIEIPRLPEETLHEYLLRSQHILASRIEMVARARDAAEHILSVEHARWRFDRIVLTFVGPLWGASAYVGLVRTGIAEFARPEFIVGVITFAGLTGGPLVLTFATYGPRLTTWLVSQTSRCLARLARRPR